MKKAVDWKLYAVAIIWGLFGGAIADAAFPPTFWDVNFLIRGGYVIIFMLAGISLYFKLASSSSRHAVTSGRDDDVRRGADQTVLVDAESPPTESRSKFKIKRHWLGSLDTDYDLKALSKLFQEAE